MKKIAFFVEGQTEQIFMCKLLREIAGHQNISIETYELIGGGKKIAQIIGTPTSFTNPSVAAYEALIYNCGNDEKVASDIKDYAENLEKSGCNEIVGIRDLFPKTSAELTNVEQGLSFVKSLIPIKIPCDFIIAVR